MRNSSYNNTIQLLDAVFSAQSFSISPNHRNKLTYYCCVHVNSISQMEDQIPKVHFKPHIFIQISQYFVTHLHFIL